MKMVIFFTGYKVDNWEKGSGSPKENAQYGVQASVCGGQE
jgi:hypothetical protein